MRSVRNIKGRLMMDENKLSEEEVNVMNKVERNRRLKLGLLGIALCTFAYALAKITNDTSGDWFRFSLLTLGIVGFIGGYITLTDILGKKF